MSLFSKISSKIKYNKYLVLSFGTLAFVAHPFYWFWWTYVFPNSYENPYLRICGSLSGLIMLILMLKEEKFKRIIPLYWIFVVIYNLPFLFTFMMIKNHLIEIWLMAEIIPIFVVLLFIPSFLGALSVLAIGIISAITLAKVTGETVIYPTNLLLSHLVIYLLAIFGGSILNKAHLLGIETVEKEKSKILLERAQIFKYLAGAIAHELRNPLNTINFIGDQIKSVLVEDFNASTKKKLGVLTSQVSESISEANNIINIILSDLNENPVDARDFVLLKSEDIIPKIIQNYGYKNQEEKNRVKFVTGESSGFVFNAVPERFIFIIYNLLKNALYYLNEYPTSQIIIGTEVKKIKGARWCYAPQFSIKILKSILSKI